MAHAGRTCETCGACLLQYKRWACGVQVRDQRNGDLKKHLKAVTLLEISIRVSQNSDGSFAEAALVAFAKRLRPVEMTSYH
jgi:hypothetical protein